MQQDSSNVTTETLEATPGRALKFLSGVGRTPAVRAALAAVGYTEAEHSRGWALLHAASGFRSGGSDLGTPADPEVNDAIHKLDAWDEDGFRIVRAALGRAHPEIAATVLDGIGPQTGAAAVVGVETLLDRLDALAHDKKNKSAHAALSLLATRGITEQKRKDLRKLVEIAKIGTAATAPAEDETSAADRAAHTKALNDLRAWFVDWSEMAKTQIKRRDRLIRLGLASPKKRRPTATPPAATTTPPGP